MHTYVNRQFDNDSFTEYLLEAEGDKVDSILTQIKTDVGDKLLEDMSDRDFYALYKTYALRQ